MKMEYAQEKALGKLRKSVFEWITFSMYMLSFLFFEHVLKIVSSFTINLHTTKIFVA